MIPTDVSPVPQSFKENAWPIRLRVVLVFLFALALGAWSHSGDVSVEMASTGDNLIAYGVFGWHAVHVSTNVDAPYPYPSVYTHEYRPWWLCAEAGFWIAVSSVVVWAAGWMLRVVTRHLPFKPAA